MSAHMVYFSAYALQSSRFASHYVTPRFLRQNLHKFKIRILASGASQVEVYPWQVYLEAFMQHVLVNVSINFEWLPCSCKHSRPVHTIPKIFEKGVYTLKTHQIFFRPDIAGEI